MIVKISKKVCLAQLMDELVAQVPAAMVFDRPDGVREACSTLLAVGEEIEAGGGCFTGAVLEVADTADRAAIDRVIAAHVPAAALQLEVATVAAPTLEAKLLDALEALPEGPLTKTDLADVIATLRGDNA